MSAPFFVEKATLSDKWGLTMRRPYRFVGWFDTQGEAIDHAYRNWPWYL